MLKETFIIYAKRTPLGKLGGSLAPVRVDDLMATLLKDYKQQCSFDLNAIDDIIVGCANQAGEDNRNLARMAALLAEYPFAVPATTINRLCGSSLDGVLGAVGRISAGIAECVLVGGAESMTRAPYALAKAEGPYGRTQKIYDTTFGWRFPNPKMPALFPLYGMGETAEEVAKLYQIERQQQDQYALASHQKAAHAHAQGHFKNEILPIQVDLKKSSYLVEKDECVRDNSSLTALAKLPPVFRKNGSVTAGNSSPMNDGASLVAIVSGAFLKTHKLTPLLKITGAAVRGVHPNTMGLGPIAATEVLCKKFAKKISDFDIIELNEAFAAQSLACIKGLELDPAKVNLRGGAIALGHPLGCSGTRILTTLTHTMQEHRNYKQGLATMCVGVGQGVSLSVENI